MNKRVNGTSQQTVVFLVFAPEVPAWRRQMGLRVVCWEYGVAMSLAVIILETAVLDARQMPSQQVRILEPADYTSRRLIAIWKCAPNAGPSWSHCARGLAFAWVLKAAFVRLSLQIELMHSYAR